jgi:hypothetical protein
MQTELQKSHTERQVLMLDTDERSGLVAAIALECHKLGVSIEITTGHNHILLTFNSELSLTDSIVSSLAKVPGVNAVHLYDVLVDTETH